MDEEGYFFITDRLKRMINASGFKVWPAEVEALLYRTRRCRRPASSRRSDAYRGETVKAVVVLRAERQGQDQRRGHHRTGRASTWPPTRCPSIVQFVDALPKSGSGKVMWRLLQEQESAAKA